MIHLNSEEREGSDHVSCLLMKIAKHLFHSWGSQGKKKAPPTYMHLIIGSSVSLFQSALVSIILVSIPRSYTKWVFNMSIEWMDEPLRNFTFPQ